MTDKVRGLLRNINKSWRDIRRHGGMNVYRDPIFDGLDITQIDILDLLEQKDRWRMIDLARELHLDKSTITRSIQRLESAGLVEREDISIPGRRRSVTARTTAKGHILFQQIDHFRDDLLREMLSDYSPQQIADIAEAYRQVNLGLRKVLSKYKMDNDPDYKPYSNDFPDGE